MAVGVWSDVPLALCMLTQERLAKLVDQSTARSILCPNIIVSLRPAFEPDAHKRPCRVQQAAGLAPEMARLKDVAVHAGSVSLRHSYPLPLRAIPSFVMTVETW